ncbi:hypothetical protein G647_08011 [Cladophialophora carrionii CBS 160.54]|uniref:Uncharacterized protein n=1 Tax=Cladophialophora carrionii CBS 160.54 TaxID=1279043 RepID=V9D426_9EURO|nr:uncharacterized protein G647_08011 [Cladophialophora carrionii CBS 160.54]ETI21664.1 hypothetical protein G647_08011 [Cladophialophora carrionii CBS 160.54]
MVLFDPADTALAAVVRSINATTPAWRLGPLNASWVVVTDSIPPGSDVNGHNYSDSHSDIGGTIVVQRKVTNSVGSLPLNSFVYLMISAFVIIVLIALPNCKYIARLLLGKDTRFDTDCPHSATGISEFTFNRMICGFYPPEPRHEPLPSYLEALDYVPGREVRSSDVRECQSMIRRVYLLKVKVFNAGNVHPANLGIVDDWRLQAKAGLSDIRILADSWAQRHDWSPEEKMKVAQIRQRIMAIQTG